MKYITVKLTEDQAKELSRILDNCIYDTEQKAKEYETSVKPEFIAFVKRIQAKLAQAKS